MSAENKEPLGIAEHLRQRATRYREFAAQLADERAAALMARLAADFDERAFDLIYAARLGPHRHAA